MSDAAVAMPSIITAKALIAILESVAVLSFWLDQVEQEDGDRFAREIAADRDRVRITSVRRARAGLTRSSRKTAADPLPTASHSQPARVEVHILPAEAQRLAEAEAESESHLTERLQPIALDGRQEALRLLRREGLDRLPLGMDSVDQSAATLRRR